MPENTLRFAEPALSNHGFKNHLVFVWASFSSSFVRAPRESLESSDKGQPPREGGTQQQATAGCKGSVTSVDGDGSHEQALDLHLGGILSVATAVDSQQRGATALGAQHRHVDEGGVVRLAGVIGAGRQDPAVPQQ